VVHGAVAFAVSLSAAMAEGPSEVRPKPEPTVPRLEPWASEPFRADAGLNDVFFCDSQQGWAVGDRGVIWHTEDGGRNWVPQRSSVSCRLESVWFVSPQVGWAVGGFSQPYLHTGSGVLLRTQDGGQHWVCESKLALPYLKRARFFSARSGWAIGHASALYPLGLLFTETGGASWNPASAEWSARGDAGSVPNGPSEVRARAFGLLAGDCLPGQIGSLAGRGLLATLRNNRIEPAEPPETGLRGITQIRLSARHPGWLVGQGGLVLLTHDHGATWQPPPRRLPEMVTTQFDFHALDVRGPKCWIAGRPGTRIFHSPDAGHTWYAAATGQNLPICAIRFADEQCGWAVGALGTILATADGGQTWTRQRAGGTRAAILGLFAEPDDVPFEWLARYSGNEGYLTAVEVLYRRDLESPPRDEVPLAQRIHDAVLRVGACAAHTAWQFPLRQPGLSLSPAKTLALWDAFHEGAGRDELGRHLVRQIRTWRPEVIVLRDAAAAPDRPEMSLLNQAVLEAVAHAADPAAYPQMSQDAGLAPWQVRRVCAVLPSGTHGGTVVTASQLADRLGRSVGDLADDARALIRDRFQPDPQSTAFEVVFDQTPGSSSGRDVLAGLALPPGSEARRALPDASVETLDRVRRLAQKRRAVEAIFERTERDPRAAAGLLAQIEDLLRGLDPDSAGDLLYQLAQRYVETGRWDAAAEIHAVLADRLPDHPATPAAMAWLVAYYASGEAAARTADEPGAVRQASTFPVAAPRIDRAARLQRAAMWGTRLKQTRPDLFAQPHVAFALASVERQRLGPRQAEPLYAAIRRGGVRDAWWACAQGEAWLADPRGTPPKPTLRCAQVPSRPRLDGRLDDAAWKAAVAADLHSDIEDDATWPATVLLAHDDQFLYVAIRAGRAPDTSYEATSGPRPRDGDLSARDRVELIVDLDRDHATWYRLVIDSRGWTAEDCWGDPSWDPSWFVAAGTDDQAWTAEAAIPFSQLGGRAPEKGTVWSVGIQRVVPGTGFQAWNRPAAVNLVPEGLGYLVFE
jgi:photosystem II stability/assembly factor-like uncharacterized protein